VPRYIDDGIVDAAVCAACLTPTFDAIRAVLDADILTMMEVAVWLRSQLGVRDAALELKQERAALTAGVRELLDELEANHGTLGPRAMCSQCYGLASERTTTVIPFWNDDLTDYVTTFRCARCLPAALTELQARIAGAPDAEIVRVCEFLGRHAIFVHEYMRGDPIATVRPLVTMIVARIADRSMVIPIGPTQPLA